VDKEIKNAGGIKEDGIALGKEEFIINMYKRG